MEKRKNSVQDILFSFEVLSILCEIAGYQTAVQKCDAIIRLIDTPSKDVSRNKDVTYVLS